MKSLVFVAFAPLALAACGDRADETRGVDHGDTAIADGDVNEAVFPIGEPGVREEDCVWHVVPSVRFQLCIRC